MTEIWTNDLFKVAYLLSKGQRLHSVGFDNGKAQFIIKGEYIEMHDLRYKTGRALINPLILKESIRFLEQITKKDIPTLYRASKLLEEEEEGYFSTKVEQVVV
jgi:hypothetical protein